MKPVLKLSRAIDRATAWVGSWVAWLILVAILVSAVNATVRKFFNISSNAWLELQWYLYGAVFMMAAAAALQKNEHVRIDVVSAHLSQRARDWIDLICHICFLTPFVVLMSWLSWPFFLRSYATGEQSMNAGGLILWPAKIFILLGFVLLTFQALSEIIKKIAVLRSDIPPPGGGREDAPPEAHELVAGYRDDAAIGGGDRHA